MFYQSSVIINVFRKMKFKNKAYVVGDITEPDIVL